MEIAAFFWFNHELIFALPQIDALAVAALATAIAEVIGYQLIAAAFTTARSAEVERANRKRNTIIVGSRAM